MAQATHNTTTLRRAILTGLCTAPVALAVVPAAAAAPAALAVGHEPDAELVALWRQWRERYDLVDVDDDTSVDKWNQILDRICRTPAHGLTGLAVKAKLAAYFGTDAWSVAIEALVEDVLLTAGVANDPDIIRAGQEPMPV